MRKAFAWLLTAVLLVTCAGCGQREPVDITRAITLGDLTGACIGAQEYTYHAEAASQISKATVVTYPTFADMRRALAEDKIDGFVAEEPTAKAYCLEDATLSYVPLLNNTTGFTVDTASISVAAALPEGSPLCAQMNTVLATITTAQKQALMDSMVAAAGGDMKAYAGLPADDAELPADAPVLRVGMECTYAPFNWAVADTGGEPVVSGGQKNKYVYGYDVEIARYVARTMGMRLEIHSVEWALLPEALESGKIDAIFAGMTAVEFPDASFSFTNPYYESQLVVVTKKATDSTAQ